jgi:hypothetical protein
VKSTAKKSGVKKHAKSTSSVKSTSKAATTTAK